MSKYILTEEGKKYLKHGLPEKILVEMVEKESVDFAKANDEIDNFVIALQWAKKKEWVKISEGKIFLNKKPSEFPEQRALEKISKDEHVNNDILSILIQRKLVEEERETMIKRAEKMTGKEIGTLTEELIKTGKWKDVKLKHYNVEFPGKKIYPGKRQPYNKFLSDVRQKLVELGFIEMKGPTIETEFWNFDALYQPQNHPSRDWTQTYSLKQPKSGALPDVKLVRTIKAAHENGWTTGSTGWGYVWDPKKAAQLMPRAHGTALSARTLAGNPEIPGKYFAIVRCYRPDVIDATHGVEFNQCEGIIIDENVNFRNMLGILKQFAIEFAGIDKVKFITDYYPFTEPSVQMSAKHPKMGWIELAGAGIFREEFVKALGVDVPVLAWGIGIDRLAMYKLGINDIRYMFSQNLEWLRNQVIV
jgi:phenylalanyl-tRNA synthetase alpha chain